MSEKIALSLDKIEEMLESDPSLIRFLEPQSETLQRMAINCYYEKHKKHKSNTWYNSRYASPLREFWEEHIAGHTNSREVKLLALSFDANLMELFHEYSADPEFQKTAIDSAKGRGIFEFFTDVSPEVMSLGIKKWYSAMTDYVLEMPNPPTSLLEELIDESYSTIYLISKSKFVTRDLLMRAVEVSGRAINYIPDELIFPELLETAIRTTPSAIKCINKPNDELVYLAIDLQPSVVLDLGKPPKYEYQLAAVKKDGLLLRHFKSRARREVQYQAICQNPEALKYVKNPTMEMKLIAG